MIHKEQYSFAMKLNKKASQKKINSLTDVHTANQIYHTNYKMGLEDFGLTDGPDDDDKDDSTKRNIKPKSEQGTKSNYTIKADLEVTQGNNNSTKIISNEFISVLKVISNDIVSNGVTTSVVVQTKVEAVSFAEAMKEADYEFNGLETTVEEAMSSKNIKASANVKMSTYRT